MEGGWFPSTLQIPANPETLDLRTYTKIPRNMCIVINKMSNILEHCGNDLYKIEGAVRTEELKKLVENLHKEIETSTYKGKAGNLHKELHKR